MSPMIPVSDEVYSRLEKLAVGFDTPSNVVERLLDENDNRSLETDNNESVRHRNLPATESSNRRFTNREIQQRISAVAGRLSAQELEQLCNERVSKELFGLSFPLFVRVSSKANQATKRAAVKSNDGVARWTWKFEFVKEGYAYAVCTQWYPKNDEYVRKWLEAYE